MKYSQPIGIVFSLLLIYACYLPWSFITGENWLISGMETLGTHYGKPGTVHIFFACITIILFIIPKLWSKRVNIFICFFNLAWLIRNFILFSGCYAGNCPELKAGLYLSAASSIIMLVMALLPKIPIKEN
ncbi:MAG: hypothetical protein PW786_02005 [Arachidicoccus sp.]|nr:hypothetical protein [Arachidicoccus sp.]